jgi:hypothetical protein
MHVEKYKNTNSSYRSPENRKFAVRIKKYAYVTKLPGLADGAAAVDSPFVSSPVVLENSERDVSPGSDDPNCLTPVAPSSPYTADWLSPPPRRTSAPRLRVTVPQAPGNPGPGYPITPPGDRAGVQFSPHQERGTLGSPFHVVPLVSFPEPGHSPSYNDAMDIFPSASSSAQEGGFSSNNLLEIPEIVVSEMNPTLHSPMTPVGFHHHHPNQPQFPEMDIMSEIDAHHSASTGRITTLSMGSPAPPRQHQHQFEGDMEVLQGEVLSMGYGAIPPGRFRIKF